MRSSATLHGAVSSEFDRPNWIVAKIGISHILIDACVQNLRKKRFSTGITCTWVIWIDIWQLVLHKQSQTIYINILPLWHLFTLDGCLILLSIEARPWSSERPGSWDWRAGWTQMRVTLATLHCDVGLLIGYKKGFQWFSNLVGTEDSYRVFQHICIYFYNLPIALFKSKESDIKSIL